MYPKMPSATTTNSLPQSEVDVRYRQIVTTEQHRDLVNKLIAEDVARRMKLGELSVADIEGGALSPEVKQAAEAFLTETTDGGDWAQRLLSHDPLHHEPAVVEQLVGEQTRTLDAEQARIATIEAMPAERQREVIAVTGAFMYKLHQSDFELAA